MTIMSLIFTAFLVAGAVAIAVYCVGDERGWHNLEGRNRGD